MAGSSIALDNPYQAPDAELIDAINTTSHFVVSTKKLFILETLTMGLYSIYWFYKNYKIIRTEENNSIQPALRAIFQVFFTFNLFRRVENSAKSNNVSIPYSTTTLAALYVALCIFTNLSDQISYTVGFIGYLAIPASAWILMQVQTTVNSISDDREGLSNHRFTLANYLWCFLGFLLWLVVVVDAAVHYGLLAL